MGKSKIVVENDNTHGETRNPSRKSRSKDVGAPNGTLAQLTRHFVRHANQSLDAFFWDSSPFACSATMDGQ